MRLPVTCVFLAITCMLVIYMSVACLGSGYSEASVSGSVSIATASNQPIRLSGAKLSFERKGELATEVITNDKGEYKADLDEGEYTVSLTSQGMCTVHRPPFGLKRKTFLRFDFTIVVCPFVDYITLPRPDDLTGSAPEHSPGMYYKEDRVVFGGDSSGYLILAYGLSQREPGRVRYESYASPFSDAPGRLPVTMSFDTYTVRADSVELDESTRVVRAEGHVSIADGTDAPPATSSCVLLSLRDAPPKMGACQ